MQNLSFTKIVLLFFSTYSMLGCDSCCEPDLTPKPGKWHQWGAPIITAMTKDAKYIGSSNGVINQGFSGGGNMSITSTNYSGSGTPYLSTIKAIGSNKFGNIFAGTDGAGIYKRLNPGWEECLYNLTNPSKIIAFATNNQNGKMFAISAESAIYRSIDNGDTWSQVVSVGIYDDYKCITINTSDGFIYVGYRWGIIKSTDDGDNWTQIIPSLQSPVSLLGLYGTVDLGLSGNTVYALTPSSLLTSNDKGTTWSMILGPQDLPGGHQFTCLSLAYALGGPSIYIGSSNTGVTYREVTSSNPGWITDNNSNGLTTNSILFSGNDGGIIYLAGNENTYRDHE